MSNLTLHLSNGTDIVVPANLHSTTTYVLLEQEAWFEKEINFLSRVLKPGACAIDIGASLGVYSLPMAKLVGAHGKVVAYEPARESSALLSRNRLLNHVEQLEVIASAVSDSEGIATLGYGNSSEEHSLSTKGRGESVQVTSIDRESKMRSWTLVDFMKIDAEGEEAKIIRGGAEFFRAQSPLVQFEFSVADTATGTPRYLFPELGYRVYRMMPGAILVPTCPSDVLDQFELNLFAVKSDRADALHAEGLLIHELDEWHADEALRRTALDLWSAQPFAPGFASGFTSSLDPVYGDVLAAYAFSRASENRPERRVAALEFSCRELTNLCEKAPTYERLSTLARVTADAGQRKLSFEALKRLLVAAEKEKICITEPFWPAAARFDGLFPVGDLNEWFVAAAVEQMERTLAHSSIFGRHSGLLNWLCGRDFAATEMERRRVLYAALSGQRVRVPERLRNPAADHLNAETWRSGLIPNTVV